MLPVVYSHNFLRQIRFQLSMATGYWSIGHIIRLQDGFRKLTLESLESPGLLHSEIFFHIRTIPLANMLSNHTLIGLKPHICLSSSTKSTTFYDIFASVHEKGLLVELNN